MKASMNISLFGTGLLVLCAGTLMAQEAGTRASGRGQDRDGAAQGINARGAEGASAGMESRMLIGHAVSMAIGSVTLKGQAEQAGQASTPGQADAQGGRAQAGAGLDPAQQLMTHARKGMQESQRLLQGAGRDQASAKQLYTAANGYINTLFALCGESSATRGAGAARTGDAAEDAGRARTGRSARDEDLGAGQAGRQGKALSARDKAAVALINHSVCEVIEGTHITHMLHSQAAGGSSASETLRRHAREMTTEGRETLQRFLGSAQPGAGGAGNAGRAENDPSRAVGDAANAAGGREGDVSVTTLARRGQELIEAFQASSQGQGGAQEGSERPGGLRRDREGNAPGTGRSPGTGRTSGAENPR